MLESFETGHCFREGWSEAPAGNDAQVDAEQAARPPAYDADSEPGPQPDAARPPQPDAALPAIEAGAPTSPGHEPPPLTAACEPVLADAQLGSFVSPPPVGSDAEGCGTPVAPCATIARARDRSLALEQPLVYLDSGSYAEAIVLLPGITLQGGWTNQAGVWTRQCSSNRALSARVQSPRSYALWAEYDGEAQVDTLSLETMTTASAGQSLYGVFARGAGTKLVLNDVYVRAGDGGSGGDGRAGASPAPAMEPCAAPGDASNGAPDGRAGVGGAAGGWSSEGYSPGAGERGGAGVPGQNGTLGAPLCVTCVDACNRNTCSGNASNLQSCGQAGAPGCGGAAADGGAGGGGGGSSTGIFAWAAQVRVQGGWLEAGNGGDGGSGGAPGEGGTGSEGGVGANADTCTVCQKLSLSNPAPAGAPLPGEGSGSEADPGRIASFAPLQCRSAQAAGLGGRGGRGGAGSRGGPGGGGAGGHSYGAYTGGAAVLNVSPETRIQIGEPGSSRSTGAQGMAAELSSD